MQKISPLRSSIEAFNKFKAMRASKASKNEATKANEATSTNPFGITFRGTVIQMDVFEKTDKTENNENSSAGNGTTLKEKLQNTGKLLASAWVGTINKFSSIKTNAIAFGNKIKESTIATAKKIQEFGNREITFDLDLFKYNVSNLQNRPVSELSTMLSNELQGVTNE